MSNNKYSVKVFDTFFGDELTGEFFAATEQEAIVEAKGFYAMELDTVPEEIVIVNVAVA